MCEEVNKCKQGKHEYINIMYSDPEIIKFCLKYSSVVYITKFDIQIPTLNYSV